jgi:hypothetical protein
MEITAGGPHPSGKLQGAHGRSQPLAKALPVSVCVECGRPIGTGPLREGVLCRHCDAGHSERSRRQEVTREALAWAFVTLVFLALVGWGLGHLVASGALALH